jgi:coenzyme F420-dependent glucose-6-phosphate dehydrogenase
MVEIGYGLASQAHTPTEVVHYAQLAEQAGFSFALLLDSPSPVTPEIPSPFVWSLIGAIAQTTSRLHLGACFTYPRTPLHPALLAQAAATAGALMPGRFFLGVGIDESPKQHLLDPQAALRLRLEMLVEAVRVIRLLWKGGEQSHWGPHYRIENVRLYPLPDTLPAIMVAAECTHTAAVAGRMGDGLMSTACTTELAQSFVTAGGEGKPRYGTLTVCWAPSLAQAIASVPEAYTARVVVCGADPARHLAAMRQLVRAGYNHICVQHIGPDQAGCLRFYQHEVLPMWFKERRPQYV